MNQMERRFVLTAWVLELKVLRSSPGVLNYAAVDVLVSLQLHSDLVPEKYVVTIASAFPNSLSQRCQKRLHDILSCIMQMFVVLKVEYFRKADRVEPFDCNQVGDLAC